LQAAGKIIAALLIELVGMISGIVNIAEIPDGVDPDQERPRNRFILMVGPDGTADKESIQKKSGNGVAWMTGVELSGSREYGRQTAGQERGFDRATGIIIEAFAESSGDGSED
jgi:hypothetical protein